MKRESKLLTLARTTMLTPAQAVALPTAITSMATKLKMTEDAAIDALLGNFAAAMYVASVCRQVTK